DEDGVPDLVCGYSGSDRGVIALHQGNADSIYPHTPEALKRKAEGRFTEAPFLSPALLFPTSIAPEFIGAGDFDGDSHWDVVTAARGDNKLFLMSGDGHGNLGEPTAIPLPGRITVMITGEINRRDGLDDLIVGITTRRGAEVLVFEGPRGALQSKPEVIA